MKESIKARVEKLEKTVGHTIVLIVVDNVKEPGFATVDGKKMTLDELETLLKGLPKNVKVFQVEVTDNAPFKGKVQE